MRTALPDRTREVHESFKCTVYYRDTDNNSGLGDNAQVAYWYGPWEDAPVEPADDSWTEVRVK